MQQWVPRLNLDTREALRILTWVTLKRISLVYSHNIILIANQLGF